MHRTITHEPVGDFRRACPSVFLRCPACGATFALEDSRYSLDLLINDGVVQHRRYLLCCPCSVLAVRGGQPAQRVLRRAIHGISKIEARYAAQ